MDLLIEALRQTYLVTAESGGYILGGLVLAGLVHVFVNPRHTQRLLGPRSFGSVLRAAAVGVPLPLCSCSVVPVASGLKRDGASDGAVTAFLIATPETGVDAVAISWALLDPILTVARVIAAFVTALAGGFAVHIFGRTQPAPPVEPASACGCAADGGGSAAPGAETGRTATLWRRIRVSQHYAFTDLFGSLAPYFCVGLLATGLIAAIVPVDFLDRWVGGGVLGMCAVLVVGIPLYVCATASTPLAAALILKGMSPGTALVFLLAGPATNLATMTVVRSILGWRGLGIYLGAIATCALGLGLALDAVYDMLGTTAAATLHYQPHAPITPVEHVGAVLFAVCLVATLLHTAVRRRAARS